MKFELFKADGSSAGEIEFENFPVLEGEKGLDALRQTVIASRANRRQGNASTKLRSEVAGSGKKIFRQKGLGVGRAGDKKAIQRRGGVVIFGPRPRSYNQKINKKIKRLAFQRALFDQANSSSISLITEWKATEAKTKPFKSLISSIVSNSRKVLIIGNSFTQEVELSARNLPNIILSTTDNLAVLDLVQADKIIVSEEGMKKVLNKYSGDVAK